MKTVPYEFDPQTINLLLRGLDHLPHGQVRQTYDQIAAHAQHTLSAPDGEEPAPRRHIRAGRYQKQG